MRNSGGVGQCPPPLELRIHAYSVRNMRNFAVNLRRSDKLRSETRGGRQRQATQFYVCYAVLRIHFKIKKNVNILKIAAISRRRFCGGGGGGAAAAAAAAIKMKRRCIQADEQKEEKLTGVQWH